MLRRPGQAATNERTADRMKFVLSTNPWVDPNATISLEGGRDDETRRSKRPRAVDESAQAEAQRAVVGSLRPFVGSKVTLQAWDPIMTVLDEEGPFPISAVVTELVAPDGESSGVPALRLHNARSHKDPDGYDLLTELERDGDCDCVIFPLSRLYWIED